MTQIATQVIQPVPELPAALQGRPALLLAAEAAEIMRITERTWRRWAARGLIPRAVHVGGRSLWPIEALREILERHKSASS
jgi:hypothetical protein